MNYLIDTHSHIYAEEFDADRDEAIRRAREAGVERLLLPAIDSESHGRLFDTVRRYPDHCTPMMGLHPTSINDNPRWREELALVERYLCSPPEGVGRFCAVGEIGLDYYWDDRFKAEQLEAFTKQCRLAATYDLPVAIHTRAAWKDMCRTVETETKAAREKGLRLRGVFHAFAEDADTYRQLKECGDFLFGIGGVESSLYSTIRSSQGSSVYYNQNTSAYCYIGTEKPNHDVVIIGWDDNYSRSNFNTPLEGDGAFICQNSWGDGFGENGIFYVSYYDTNIGTHNVAYTRVDDVHNYDHIYQSDLCGWVGKLGYDSDQIYGANVFEAKGSETLSAASFYATGANTQYEVCVVHDFENEKSFAQREQLASGTLQKAGYYTVDFDTKVSLKKGERYAVLVYLKTPGTKHPMAIEYDTGEKILQGVDLDDGEGYISLNGKNFVNVKEKKDCNLCIKAFTRD